MQSQFVNEGVTVCDAPTCYLCGRPGQRLFEGLRDRLFTAPGVWNLSRCPSCGLVWLDPCPEIEEIHKLYTDYYTHGTGNSISGLRRLLFVVSATTLGYADIPLRQYERIAGRTLGFFGPVRDVAGGSIMWLDADTRGRLLDIGSGNGWFLAKMRALGWNIDGVEPDHEGVRTALEVYGINTHHGLVEDMDFGDAMFDAITMNHVIEHLSNPIATLRVCERILKPGGRLIVTTPNTESLVCRHFGEDWLAWDPPRHLHLFTTQTLVRCAEKAGLHRVNIRTSARTAQDVWQASALLRSRHLMSTKVRSGRGLWLGPMTAMIHLFEHGMSRIKPVGEELVMVATKGEAIDDKAIN